MASEKAIEAARREAIQRNLSSAWQDPNDIYHILNAASAIDGDYNAGVEACQEYLRSIHHTNTADMLEKLKRP